MRTKHQFSADEWSAATITLIAVLFWVIPAVPSLLYSKLGVTGSKVPKSVLLEFYYYGREAKNLVFYFAQAVGASYL
jgi:hypothetical protein